MTRSKRKLVVPLSNLDAMRRERKRNLLHKRKNSSRDEELKKRLVLVLTLPILVALR